MSPCNTRFTVVLTSLLAMTVAAQAAGPRGNVLAPEDIPEKARAELRTQIAQARVEDPKAFEDVASLRDGVALLDRNKRGPLLPMASIFRQLGPRGLLPLLEMLAFDAPARGDLPDSAWIALRAGAIEAVGDLRDQRAAPVLYAILDGPETEYYVVRATVEAIGLYGDDSAVKRLTAEAGARGPKRFAVLAAVGYCRRAAIARVLADALAERPDDETAKMLARSLSDVGNSYVWTIARFVERGEGDDARRIAAEALVSGFVHYRDHVRQSMSNALMVVDSDATPALLEAALGKASDAELATELRALGKRFEANPVRR